MQTRYWKAHGSHISNDLMQRAFVDANKKQLVLSSYGREKLRYNQGPYYEMKICKERRRRKKSNATGKIERSKEYTLIKDYLK